jgi:hypothetical protein
VALTDIAANFIQSSPACHRLDAFGHYLHIEFVPKLHACPQHARHVTVAFAITYETGGKKIPSIQILTVASAPMPRTKLGTHYTHIGSQPRSEYIANSHLPSA